MKIRLTELIEEKSFNELSKEEQSFVLTQVSEEEYNEKHQLIANVKDELKSEANELKANESIRLSALAALRAKQIVVEPIFTSTSSSKTKVKSGFFNFKIPLWTAVAAVFMIFILSTPVFIESQLNSNKSNQLVASVDTIYIDKIIRDTIEITKPADRVVKTVYVTNNDISQKVIAENEFETNNDNQQLTDFSINRSDNIQNELEMRMAIGGYTNTIDFSNPKSGRSLSEDKIGKVVLEVVN
jgi:hypothetical protein